jgi:hypothetical protein
LHEFSEVKGLAKSQALSALHNPAEFSRFVIGYAPRATEKVELCDSGTFVGLNSGCD